MPADPRFADGRHPISVAPANGGEHHPGGMSPRSWAGRKLIADRQTHTILGAHVLGEYSAGTVQTVAACMAAGMTIEQVAELQLAFPTFTEAVCVAAQKICRTLGIGRFRQAWSYLGPEDWPTASLHDPAAVILVCQRR